MLLEQKEKNSALSFVAVYDYRVFTFVLLQQRTHCNMASNYLYCCKIQYEGNWSNCDQVKSH